jgi:hypothetical protein
MVGKRLLRQRRGEKVRSITPIAVGRLNCQAGQHHAQQPRDNIAPRGDGTIHIPNNKPPRARHRSRVPHPTQSVGWVSYVRREASTLSVLVAALSVLVAADRFFRNTSVANDRTHFQNNRAVRDVSNKLTPNKIAKCQSRSGNSPPGTQQVTPKVTK